MNDPVYARHLAQRHALLTERITARVLNISDEENTEREARLRAELDEIEREMQR